MEIKEMTLEQVITRMSELSNIASDVEKRSALTIEEMDAMIEEKKQLEERKKVLEDEEQQRILANKEEVQKRHQKLDDIANGKIDLPILEKKEEKRKMEFEKETVLSTTEYRSAWAKSLLGHELNEVEKRAYSTATGAGAEVIPVAISDEIIKKVYEYAPVLQGLKLLRVPGNLKWAIVDNEDEAAIHTQNGAITGASDTLKEISLGGYEILKVVSASKAVKTMSLPQFEAFIVDALAENLARRIEKFVFLGTGSSQPTGLEKAGAGVNGAYTDGTDQVSVNNVTAVTEADVLSWYGMVGSFADMKAYMSKATFMAYFYPLMNVGKNISVRFVNGQYFILDIPVQFTNTLTKGVAYLASLQNVIANMAQDIQVESSAAAGFNRNAIDFKADCLFDCKPIVGRTAFAKFVKAQA